MSSMTSSRAIAAFVFLIAAFVCSLGNKAIAIGAKTAPTLHWQKTSGDGLGLFVARKLRFTEDRGFPTVAALNLHDLAPLLQA